MTTAGTNAATAAEPDGRVRCHWVQAAPQDYIAYHDHEWGHPLHGNDALFERVALEAFQSGLSWLIVLRKRPAFRVAFAGFSIARVAEFDDADVARLLADSGIVRNRAKIVATIGNARAAAALPQGLDAFLWSFAPTGRRRRPATPADIPTVSAESTAMAKALRQAGFSFVGPTTSYAMMQATGMVDDHLASCWRAAGAARPHRPRG